MPKIRFLEDRIVQDADRTKFEAGKVYELPEASCERWVRRGVAKYVTGAAKAAEAGPAVDPDGPPPPPTEEPRGEWPEEEEEAGGDGPDVELPTMTNTRADIDEFAAEHGIDISEANNKADALEIIAKHFNKA